MEGAQNSAAGNLASSKLAEMGSVARERYWEEATPEDKIERLRDEVAALVRVVTHQAAMLVKLGVHRHGADGVLMVGLTDSLEAENKSPRIFAHDGGIPHRLRKAHERR